MTTICELCKRNLESTEHHLVPKEMHNKKWCKKMFTLDEMKNNRIFICHDCHGAIHKFISNKDLAKEYNTLTKLQSHDKLMVFVNWVGKNDQRKFKY